MVRFQTALTLGGVKDRNRSLEALTTISLWTYAIPDLSGGAQFDPGPGLETDRPSLRETPGVPPVTKDASGSMISRPRRCGVRP